MEVLEVVMEVLVANCKNLGCFAAYYSLPVIDEVHI